MRIGDNELHAANAAVANLPEKDQPRVVRLGVIHVDARHAPPVAHVAADGRNHGDGGDAVPAAALDVYGIKPDVEHRRAVEGRRDGARLVLRGPGGAHLLGHPLHLADAGARGVHLGHGGDEGAGGAPVALEYVLREEAAGDQLGDAQCQRADVGGEQHLVVAVAAVRPAAAQLVGLGVHHDAHDLLGEAPEQVLHVDGAVVKPEHGEHVRRQV